MTTEIPSPVILQAVFHFSDRFLGARKSMPKKIIFFQDKFYSLKAHAHYFTVLIYLATWRVVKLGIFSHFTSTNLSRCSQSNNLLMYVYYTDSQLLFMCAWSQSCLHSRDRTTAPRTTAARKNFLFYPVPEDELKNSNLSLN